MTLGHPEFPSELQGENNTRFSFKLGLNREIKKLQNRRGNSIFPARFLNYPSFYSGCVIGQTGHLLRAR